MDEYIYDAIDLLKALISTPSVSREEDEAATLIQEKCEIWGLNPTRIGNNVICNDPFFDTSRKTILLNSHIDTVRPVAGWTLDPFTPTCEDGCIYGLGSNDAGASVVSLLTSFRLLSAQPRAYNLIFVASCEEEVSGKGGIEMVLPQLPHIDVAIVGEPTGMNPAIAEKGLMVLDGEVYGKAGHAARNEGINAIYQALPVVEKLKNLKFDKVSPYLGPIKVSVTQINAGTAHNVVPDICKLVVDVRTTDAYSNAETLDIIRKELGDSCKLTPRSTRLNPSYIPENHPIVQRAIMLGGKPFGSPTLSDQALMPFYSIKMGPADSARSHTADEYIREEEIRDAIATYTSLLSGLTI